MTSEELFHAILDRLGHAELAKAKTLIGSKTLREAIRLIVDANEGRAVLFIPHYWAEYYHDGRAGFGPVTARVLVFYNDPHDDPRLAGGYPVRATDIVRLTRDDYEAGLAENKIRRDAGDVPFMFVLKSVGPAGAHPFFDELAVGAVDRANETVTEEFDNFIQDFVDTDPDVRAETSTAVFEL